MEIPVLNVQIIVSNVRVQQPVNLMDVRQVMHLIQEHANPFALLIVRPALILPLALTVMTTTLSITTFAHNALLIVKIVRILQPVRLVMQDILWIVRLQTLVQLVLIIVLRVQAVTHVKAVQMVML